MLFIRAFINERHISTVAIRNTGRETKKGFLYHATKIDLDGKRPKIGSTVDVWHKREDGWDKLTTKVLRKLRAPKKKVSNFSFQESTGDGV